MSKKMIEIHMPRSSDKGHGHAAEAAGPGMETRPGRDEQAMEPLWAGTIGESRT